RSSILRTASAMEKRRPRVTGLVLRAVRPSRSRGEGCRRLSELSRASGAARFQVMANRTAIAATLLFCSGACALIYQTVWMREFRLVFGASTFATAAVLALFMGGLGVGSAVLGIRADAKEPTV